MTKDHKVVYAGLKKACKERQIQKVGFDRWRQKFSSNEFDIADIVNDLTTFLDLGATERKILLISMHAAFSRSETELDAVPEYIMAGESAEADIADDNQNELFQSVIKPGFVVATQSLFHLIEQDIRRHHKSAAGDWKASLLEYKGSGLSLTEVGLMDEFQKYDWALSENTDLPTCQNLAHEGYLRLTQIIGPVEADLCVARIWSTLTSTQYKDDFDASLLI